MRSSYFFAGTHQQAGKAKQHRWYRHPILPYVLTVISAATGFGIWINKIFY